MSVADPMAVEAGPAGRNGISQGLAFGLCVTILAVLVATVMLVGRGTMLDKDPVPLHKPLSQLDKARLGPYEFVGAVILPEEMEEALGTKEYIQWRLQDTRRSGADPLRVVDMFVTYYTGGRTQVPHTPERCHLGANWSTKTGWDLSFDIPAADGAAGTVNVPAKALVFNKPGLIDVQEQTVVYTFYANCGFACNTNAIRVWLNRPGVRKSFFSKVEVTFSGGAMGVNNPDPKQAAAAAQELFRTVLPVLVRDHWPREQELQ